MVYLYNRIVPTNKNKLITDKSNSEDYQNYYAEQNQTRHERVYTV